MSRSILAAIVVAVVLDAYAVVEPSLPCERQMFLFGASTVLGERAETTFEDRLSTFVRRTCREPVRLETIAEDDSKLVDQLDRILATLVAYPRSIALIHFPFTDIAEGVSVDDMLAGYRRILGACAAGNSVCIIGGQQPVNSLDDEASARQVELERRAAQLFGPSFLPLYRHLESELDGTRLMAPVDSGNGRFLNDRGHELIYALFRNRLLEISGNTQ